MANPLQYFAENPKDRSHRRSRVTKMDITDMPYTLELYINIAFICTGKAKKWGLLPTKTALISNRVVIVYH